jgi:L-ascorbate metabolism protein UlaG (beta-lactamase superfamily)
MKLTKYEHACFTLEKDGDVLIVDPGSLTTDLNIPERVVAIVITHQHADHFNTELLAEIDAKNPDALLIADQSVANLLPDRRSHPAAAGDVITTGAFKLELFGGTHASIHAEISTPPNLGVLINDQFYYPGDSFTLPEKPVDILALPAAAPWLKIEEAINFLVTINPRYAFPTHDAILSDAGKQINDAMLYQFAAANNITYQRLVTSIEI